MKKLFTLIAVLCSVLSASAVNHLFEMSTSAAKEKAWEWGVNYKLSTPLVNGETYVLTLKACTTDESYTGMAFWPYGPDSAKPSENVTLYTGFGLDTKFQERTCEFKANSNITTLCFNFGAMNGKLFFDDIKLVKKGETTNLVEDGDFEKGETFASGWEFGWNKPTTYKIAEENFAPDPVTLFPQDLKDVKTLTGTNANWAASVSYPKEFKTQGESFGDGNGDSESTHVTVTGYDYITFFVTDVTGAGNALRVWMWQNKSVKTLYPYPIDECETADFTKAYVITKPGIYRVKITGYDYLKGVKAANDWSFPSVYVGYSYISKEGDNTPIKAINGYRHFSSKVALDFTDVKEVEAYVAPYEKNGAVYLQKVEGKIPANTGLLLKEVEEAAIVTIPAVVAFDSTFANILVPVAEEKVIGKAEKGNNYIFVDGQWQAILVDKTLAAGTSYLNAKSSLATLEVSYEEIPDKDGGYMENENYIAPGEAPEGYIAGQEHPTNGMFTFPEDDTQNNNGNGAATGINGAQAAIKVVSIVAANGAEVTELQKGLNIVTFANGKRVKVLVK